MPILEGQGVPKTALQNLGVPKTTLGQSVPTPSLPGQNVPKTTSKRQKLLHITHPSLSKLVLADSMFIRKFGWEKFVEHRLGKGDLGPMESIQHSTCDHLSNLKHDGVLVTLTTPP